MTAVTGLLGALIVVLGGCGQPVDVGSDLLWTARFESGDFGEWTGAPGGSADAFPAPNMFEVTRERTHHGNFAAKLTIDAGPAGAQANVGLSRSGSLPPEGYYSAWYYLPRTVTVGGFWVIFKFRTRNNADDPTTSAELYDLDLTNLPTGEMSLRLYDHRNGDIPLAAAAPVVVPVGVWFQIEAFYRSVARSGHQAANARLTFWLDGRPIIDVTDRPPAPTSWTAWDVVSVGQNLDPSTAILYVDDCALSRTRVGPTGVIAR